MKIIHICINTPFVEGMGYQENMLCKYQSQAGHQVYVISIDFIYDVNGWKHVNAGEYHYENIKIIRLKHHRLTWGMIFPHKLYKTLCRIKPDMIMHHNINCTSLVISEYYCMLNKNCTLIADNHADYINCNNSKIVQFFLYKLLIGGSQKILGRFVDKYYGVSYMRCDFLRQMFDIPTKKIHFLPIGTDVVYANSIENKELLREKYQIPLDSLIIVSGGKMGIAKGTNILISAIEKILKDLPLIKLYLFGKFEDRETEIFAKSKEFVHIVGWCDRKKTLEILKIADIAVWPIHHTTLIEDAISVNTPIIIRKTKTTEHLVKGNGLFLNKGNMDELEKSIRILLNKKDFTEIKNACEELKSSLDYRIISNIILS